LPPAPGARRAQGRPHADLLSQVSGAAGADSGTHHAAPEAAAKPPAAASASYGPAAAVKTLLDFKTSI